MDEKMKELSQVLPSEIEARSFEIITEELGNGHFRKEAPIGKRVIHPRQPTPVRRFACIFTGRDR